MQTPSSAQAPPGSDCGPGCGAAACCWTLSVIQPWLWLMEPAFHRIIHSSDFSNSADKIVDKHTCICLYAIYITYLWWPSCYYNVTVTRVPRDGGGVTLSQSRITGAWAGRGRASTVSMQPAPAQPGNALNGMGWSFYSYTHTRLGIIPKIGGSYLSNEGKIKWYFCNCQWFV